MDPANEQIIQGVYKKTIREGEESAHAGGAGKCC